MWLTIYSTRCWPFVEKVLGRSLTPNCTFCRVYGHGAVLKAHTDRNGLDWTVSLLLRSDASWAIEVEENGRWRSMDAEVGEGVLINGGALRHRRSQTVPRYRSRSVAASLYRAE